MAIRKPPFPVTPGQRRDAYHQQQLRPRGRTSAMPTGDRKGPKRVCSLQGPPHPLPPLHCGSPWGDHYLILLPALLPSLWSIVPLQHELRKGRDITCLVPVAQPGLGTS